MGVRFKSLIGVSTLVASLATFSSAAIANPFSTAGGVEVDTVPEIVNETYFQNDRDFYENRSLSRQFNWFLGQGSLIRNSFPENEIARDARAINQLYRELLEQQVSSDPLIRTPDLYNPFDTSLLLLPTSQVGSRVVGSELVFENLPSR